MAFTLAEHRVAGRRRRVDRTVHVGILVCMGLSNDGRSGTSRITAADLTRAKTAIRHDLIEIWRPFIYNDQRTEYRYQFVVEVLASSQPAPVQTTAINDDASEVAEREGLFRDARSALLEADAHHLENIAVVAPRIVGNPHGSSIDAVAGVRDPRGGDSNVQRSLRALGGLQDRTSNAIALDFTRDVQSQSHTPAHETGHLLGLTNAHDRLSIMGPRIDDTQAGQRRVTAEDMRLIHAVIESRVPGFSRPAEAQTSDRQAPYRFEGTYTREAP